MEREKKRKKKAMNAKPKTHWLHELSYDEGDIERFQTPSHNTMFIH
jgi:hypothetical protein